MDDQRYYDPPRVAASILGWLLKDEWDTRLGDYEEYFNELAALQGERKARWWYWGQVSRLLPDRLYEKAYWGYIMVKSYFLLGFRTLRKNKVASSINLIGLSAAVGCAITLFLLIQEVFPRGDFHENGDRVFLVGLTVENAEEQRLWGKSPAPLAPALAADFPQIERAVRFADHQATVQSSGNGFQETVSFADVGFFDMLTFPLRHGQGAALADPSAVIISADMAAKYFGDQDPMGQPLVFTFENGAVESLVVRGIAEAFPHRTSMRFDFLVGYEKRSTIGLADLEDWATFTDGTFIQLKQAENLSLITDQLGRYVHVQNATGDLWQVRSYFLDNIQHPDLIRAWATEGRVMGAPPLWEAVGMGLIGLLVLLIACFNYITISLGSAARRLKEIGIRKTVGAEKRQLVMQFLAENLLLCFFALLGGLVWAGAVIIPFMYDLTSLQLQISFIDNLGLWIFLVGLLAFIGLVSGAYPAFYISAFQPVAILRGKLKLAEKKRLTRTLATVQFVLTLITISLSLFMVSLDDTLTGGDWGYDEAQTLVIPALSHGQYAKIHREILELPNVSQVAGAEHHIGSSLNAAALRVEGMDKEVAFFGVGPTYLTTMGARVEAGRAFGEAFAADGATNVVVNRTFVRQQGWADPIGQQVRIDNQAFSVIGVVEDVLLHPLAGKAQPTVFGLANEARYRFLTVRVDDTATDHVVASLETIWKQAFPEVPFAHFSQREVFQEYNFIINLTIQFSRYLGLFALFISCMGLFGMASQQAAKRIKEIGIRKAMGASAAQIVFLVNRGFLVMLGLATLIATPLCYFGLSALLSFAPIEIPLGVAPFILSNVLVFLLAALSLSMQTNRLVKINPADVLRYA